MAKITLDPILGSYASVQALNLRFQQIEDEFNSDVLYRNNPTGETNTMSNDLDMNGFSILNASDFSADALYLGASATAPTTDKLGVTLDASHTGVIYFNTVSNDMWVWNGTAWGLIGTTQNSAASVTIADIGGNYAATNVETALAELASTATNEGASIIGIEDVAGNFVSTNVEGALVELAQPKGLFDLATIPINGLTEVFITGIPSTAKRVYIQAAGISITGGPNGIGIQLANSSIVNQTSAIGTCSSIINGATPDVSAYPGLAYLLTNVVPTSAATPMTGEFVLTKQIGSDNWYLSGVLGDNTPRQHFTGGFGQASSVVDSLRFYRTGTGTFDALAVLFVYYEI